MITETYKNNSEDTLNGAINNSVTSLVATNTPSDTAGNAFLPATPQYRIRIDDEIMIVTAVNTGTKTLTVTRGAEGTTAASHSDLAPITHLLTRDSLRNLVPSWLDPLTSAYIFDDFLTGTASTGDIGNLGWTNTNGVVSYAATVSNHPGIVRLSNNATTSICTLYCRSSGSIILPTENFELNFLFASSQIDANWTFRLGLLGAINANPPADGIYIESLGASDTNFFAVCRASSSQTRADLGVAADTGWHRIRIRRKDASTIAFSLDGAAEVTITATIPSALQIPALMVISAAASVKTFDVDFFDCLITGITR
jgi:hypothetical protein